MKKYTVRVQEVRIFEYECYENSEKMARENAALQHELNWDTPTCQYTTVEGVTEHDTKK